jgi:hypothetical protein
MRKTSVLSGIALSLCLAAAAGADVIEVPAYEPPPVSSGPILPPVADRFTPTDVAAPPPPGIFAPAPPAFDRFSCDTFSCGGGRSGPSLGVIESPATPGELPGGLD